MMLGIGRKTYNSNERTISRCRPRILLYSKPAIIKIILLIILIYFFNLIINLAVRIQNNIIEYIQIPLVEYTSLALILLMALLFIWAIINLLSWKYTEYVLTNQRIITQRGILNKKRAYVYYEKIEDVSIYQSFLERILSSGDVEVYSGHDNTHIVLEDVPHPEIIEDKINEMMNGNWRQYNNSKNRNNYRSERKPRKNLTFSDPEYWEEDDSQSDRKKIKKPQKPVENKKHVVERHSERFKRK